MNKAIAYIGALSSWKRWLAAWTLGALAALSMAPHHLFIALFPAFIGLYVLLHSCETKKQALRDSWLWGLGYFMAGCYWISISLLVDPEQFAWMLPFSLIGLNGIFAIFIGLFGVAYHSVRTQKPLLNIILFAGIWLICELLRGHVLTGFPWNLIGYSLGFSLELSQLVSLIGIYGAGVIVMILALCPLMSLEKSKRKHFVMIPFFGIIALYVWGDQRLENHPTEYYEDIELLIVQGNIEQSLKWHPEHAIETLKTYLSLSSVPAPSDKARLIIWPESALPYTLEQDSRWLETMSGILSPNNILITGAVMREPKKRALYNSLVAIDNSGSILAQYNKHHLVPFGEFVPLRDILPIDKITPGQVDFSRGDLPEAITLNNTPSLLPLICYEIIFPDYSSDTESEWILNLTNDDWFGNSSGPHQHLQMAQFRAIEQSKPVVRVANSGISAVIDPVGRKIIYIPLGTQKARHVQLPKSLPNATF